MSANGQSARTSFYHVIELRRPLTDPDMFDTPVLRWQPLFGDESCRMLLPHLLLKPSRLLGAGSVEEGFSVCGKSRGQLGMGRSGCFVA